MEWRMAEFVIRLHSRLLERLSGLEALNSDCCFRGRGVSWPARKLISPNNTCSHLPESYRRAKENVRYKNKRFNFVSAHMAHDCVSYMGQDWDSSIRRMLPRTSTIFAAEQEARRRRRSEKSKNSARLRCKLHEPICWMSAQTLRDF